jgi:2-polyprenyl-6-hydroxyphenyl methylase / 3-demethylubiquinone-9 3-methyltransferase
MILLYSISYAFAIVGAEKVLKMIPNGTHNWNKFPTPDEIRSILGHCNLYVEDIRGMTYKPWKTIQWELTDNLSINYIMSAKKIQ